MTTTASQTAYESLLEVLREEAVLDSINGLLGWDQETMMPVEGAAHRAKQISLLARLSHERMTSSEVSEMLKICEGEMDLAADTDAAANVRAIRHDHDRAVRLPTALVQEAWLTEIGAGD